jgi:hypothetical protein
MQDFICDLRYRQQKVWREAEKKRKENYVGRETLPTSIKEKETHWLIKSRESPPPQDKKKRKLMGIWGVSRSTWL